jgi:hypothetical protein
LQYAAFCLALATVIAFMQQTCRENLTLSFDLGTAHCSSTDVFGMVIIARGVLDHHQIQHSGCRRLRVIDNVIDVYGLN